MARPIQKIENLKFDHDKLMAEIPAPVKPVAVDHHLLRLKRLVSRGMIDRANREYERMIKTRPNIAKFDWIDRIKKTKVDDINKDKEPKNQ